MKQPDPTTVRIPRDLLTALDLLAKARRTSRSALVRGLLLDGVVNAGIRRRPQSIRNRSLDDGQHRLRVELEVVDDSDDPEVKNRTATRNACLLDLGCRACGAETQWDLETEPTVVVPSVSRGKRPTKRIRSASSATTTVVPSVSSHSLTALVPPARRRMVVEGLLNHSPDCPAYGGAQ